MIRLIQPCDFASVCAIYNYYINHTVVTFDEQPLSVVQFRDKILAIQAADFPCFVIVNDMQEVLGFAYANEFKSRTAYRFSVEVTVYLHHQHGKKGLGSQLYQTLFAQLKQLPIHSIIAGITLPNPASVALHQQFGMAQVAHFKEVGYKFEQWLDVGYWQIIL